MAIRPTSGASARPSRSAAPPSRGSEKSEKSDKAEDKDDKKEAKKSPEEQLKEGVQALKSQVDQSPTMKNMRGADDMISRIGKVNGGSGGSQPPGESSNGGLPGGLSGVA